LVEAKGDTPIKLLKMRKNNADNSLQKINKLNSSVYKIGSWGFNPEKQQTLNDGFS
jgi:hypothetical protein